MGALLKKTGSFSLKKGGVVTDAFLAPVRVLLRKVKLEHA